MKHPKFSHAFEVVSDLPSALAPLEKLARNFRWTWHHETRDLFQSMDKGLWEASEQNPVQLLSALPQERLQKLADRIINDYRLELFTARNLVYQLVHDLALAGAGIAE